MIQIKKSKNGLFTAKFDNKYIHSKYDPIKESKQFIQGNINLIKEKNIILLYGIGLGYHVSEIINNMSKDSILYVFELNDMLIKYSKEINPNIFEYKNVKIIDNRNNDFYSKFSEVWEMVEGLIIHKGSLETIINSNEEFYNLINNYCEVKKIKLDVELNKLLDDNFKENMSHNYPMIKEFIHKFRNSNKPYIISAAGPSLDFELDLLKKYRDEFNIISVGSALKTIMNNGIKPDAVVILDGKEIVRKQLVGYENENIPLCFSSSASRWAVNDYNGPKYIFNVEADDEIIIKTRGTVAVAAIDIAVKCNAKEVILLGQDLAFIDGKSHTSMFEKVYGFKDNVKENHKNETVLGVDGDLIATTKGYMIFKNKIESLISDNNNIKFINCSRGAQIKGTNHMTFEEYMNRKFEKKHDKISERNI